MPHRSQSADRGPARPRCAAANAGRGVGLLHRRPHQRRTESSALVLRQDVHVGEVGEGESVGHDPGEADLAALVVEAEHPVRLADETLDHLERASEGPVGLVREEPVHGSRRFGRVIVDLEAVGEGAVGEGRRGLPMRRGPLRRDGRAWHGHRSLLLVVKLMRRRYEEPGPPSFTAMTPGASRSRHSPRVPMPRRGGDCHETVAGRGK